MSQRSSAGVDGSRGLDRRMNRSVRFSRFGGVKGYRFRRFAAAAVAILLVLLAASAALRRPAAEKAPASDKGPAEDLAEAEAPASACFYELLLGFEIPFLQPPLAEGRSRICALLCTVLYTLTGIDPARPFTFLNLELAAGRALSLPVSTPASSREPGGTAPPPDLESTAPKSQPWGGSLSPLPPAVDGAPNILLYHTHGSEAFIPGTATAGSVPTVVTAGAELARMLEENYGLTVLHHRDIYDQPRREAYRKARPVIERIIAENPSVELVIDLHRDGVARSRTTAAVGKRELASILMVHGCRNPGAAQNLELVFSLESELEAVQAPLSRGVMQQDLLYNQDLHPYAILLELGGHENSIDEALSSLPYLAEAIARTYHLYFMQR